MELIEGFSEYFVTVDGDVYSSRKCSSSKKLKKLKPHKRIDGYLTVRLCTAVGESKARYVHELVLATFTGDRPEQGYCCHNDGNPSNNSIENLRWDTQRNNCLDTLRHDRIRSRKLTEAQVLEIRDCLDSGMSQRTIAGMYGVTQATVTNINRGKSWSHV